MMDDGPYEIYGKDKWVDKKWIEDYTETSKMFHDW